MYSVIGLGSLILAKLAASELGLTFLSIVDKVTMDFEKVARSQTERDVARVLTVFQQKGIVQSDTTQHHRLTLLRHSWMISVFMFLTRSVLKILSFGTLYQLVKSWPMSCTNNKPYEAVQWVSAAVDRATTWYPKQAQCLQRSAVAVCLLRTCGLPAQMVIGITKVPFRSHAWAEVAGEVVNDTPKVSTRYKVLSRC
jgi:hypothetical protein